MGAVETNRPRNSKKEQQNHHQEGMQKKGSVEVGAKFLSIMRTITLTKGTHTHTHTRTLSQPPTGSCALKLSSGRAQKQTHNFWAACRTRPTSPLPRSVAPYVVILCTYYFIYYSVNFLFNKKSKLFIFFPKKRSQYHVFSFISEKKENFFDLHPIFCRKGRMYVLKIF